MAPAPPLPVTEDTPPDMLAGSMDLKVVLPDGHTVKMSVERRCVKTEFYLYDPSPDTGWCPKLRHVFFFYVLLTVHLNITFK